jgi:ABC-2 type transport system ATP-binding protein
LYAEALVCQGLGKNYGNLRALSNLNLTVPANTLFGFLGPNGAGKSTTLRILVGLSQASRGKAWIAGEEVRLNSSRLQSRIGYLPEDPAFYNWMTGREYLYFVGRIFRLPTAEIKIRGQELLEIAGLTAAANRRIGGYSRGMKQRLGIAQALMNRPAVLLLDEPCSALDPIGRLEILNTLVKLKQQTTIFMSTHILNDVERVCDQVAIMDKGKLIVESGVDELRLRFARPVFEMEFEQLTGAVVQLLEQTQGVKRVLEMRQGEIPIVRVQVENLPQTRQALLQVIAANNLALRRFEMVLPSLEEVFMELVGKHEDKNL